MWCRMLRKQKGFFGRQYGMCDRVVDADERPPKSAFLLLLFVLIRSVVGFLGSFGL